MIFALFAFLVLLFILVIAHEVGHALTARLFRCRVEEFGFGLPPRLIGRQWGQTLLSLNALPIGGFVRLHGEDDPEASDPRAFARLAPIARGIILSAGIGANVLLAILAFTLVAGLGVDVPLEGGGPAVGQPRVEIVSVRPTAHLRSANIQAGDIFVAVNGVEVTDAQAAATAVRDFTGSSLSLTVRRRSREQVVVLTFSPPKRAGELVGLALLDVGTARVPWSQAPLEGMKMTGRTIALTWRGLTGMMTQLIREGKAPEDVAGPVGIAAVTGAVVQRGFPSFLELLGVLSVNLALVNALPIPALDGGRLLFLLIESVGIRTFRGRPERLAHTIGFVVLLFLLGLLTAEDIRRLASPGGL